MDYLTIKNWNKFQQYKDREMKWIKLYRGLIVDYDFDQLTEVAQIHLVKIWLLAANIGNKIPNDASWVGRKIGAKSKVDLNQMVDAGFLFCTDFSLRSEKTVHRLEKIRRDKIRRDKNPYVEETDKKISTIYESIIEDLNTKTKRSFKHTSEKTKGLIKARLKDGFEFADFQIVHSNKADEWLGDNRMEKFLRPETLYGNKFEGYLNQGKGVKKNGDRWKGFEHKRYGETEIPEWAKEDFATDDL